jgi:hypothetical protein
VRAGVATGEKGREVVERVVDGLAGGAERFNKALTALEDSAIVRRSAAAAHGAFASVASAAESAAAAAAAATVKARRSVAGRGAASREDGGGAGAGERALEAHAHARPALPLAAACVHWLSAAPPLACEGLFSGDGTPDAVDKLAAAFKRHPGALVPLCAAPTDVAALLKRHLEGLPAPLLPYAALCRPVVPEARRAADALDAATPAGGATAELVLSLASRIACVAAVTKMDAGKLARALAPALTRRTDAPAAAAAPAPAAAEEEKAADDKKEEGADADADAPGSPLPAALPSGAPSPPPAAGEDAEAAEAAVIATLRWMIENWGTLRGGGGDDDAAPEADETELSE